MSELLTDNLSREKPLPSEDYSAKVMPRVLNTLDLTTIFIVIIFTSPIVMSATQAGAATFTYWIFTTLVFFVPCIVATAQLGAMYPNQGSLYNWTHKAFGGYWSFFVAFCAWIPGMLIIVSGGSIIVSYIQGLNPGWLIAPWQQGVVIMGMVVISGIIATQRFRTVQNFVNIVVAFLALGILVTGAAGVVWLLTGHHSATNFSHLGNWMITFHSLQNPGNFVVYGLIVYAFLGMEVPLAMGAEIVDIQSSARKRRKIVVRHLFLGMGLCVIGYLIDTFGVLVVQGNSANGQAFGFASTAEIALGKGMGNFVAICIIAFFVVEITVYNYAYARLLLVAGIDQRLPLAVARLNKHRVPANAIIFQTIVVALFVALSFVVLPLFVQNSSDLANEVYDISQASATLLWVASTTVLFINLIALYFRNRQGFRQQRIFPMWILGTCIVVGIISSIVAILDTLFYSWLGQIANDQWRVIVGSITLLCLIITAVGSVYANGQAGWEKFEQMAQEPIQPQPVR